MKESVRYKKSIMQFIQNFKPPSKKGRTDDSSSVGTGISFDTQEEEVGEVGEVENIGNIGNIGRMISLVGKKKRKPVKQMPKINTSSLMLPDLGASSEVQPSETTEKSQKRLPRKKGKGIGINVSSLVLSPEEKEPGAVTTSSVSVEPAKKPKLKKLNIAPVKLPVYGISELSEEPELSDIPEVSEDV
jgi:hypothetical protein